MMLRFILTSNILQLNILQPFYVHYAANYIEDNDNADHNAPTITMDKNTAEHFVVYSFHVPQSIFGHFYNKIPLTVHCQLGIAITTTIKTVVFPNFAAIESCIPAQRSLRSDHV